MKNILNHIERNIILSIIIGLNTILCLSCINNGNTSDINTPEGPNTSNNNDTDDSKSQKTSSDPKTLEDLYKEFKTISQKLNVAIPPAGPSDQHEMANLIYQVMKKMGKKSLIGSQKFSKTENPLQPGPMTSEIDKFSITGTSIDYDSNQKYTGAYFSYLKKGLEAIKQIISDREEIAKMLLKAGAGSTSFNADGVTASAKFDDPDSYCKLSTDHFMKVVGRAFETLFLNITFTKSFTEDGKKFNYFSETIVKNLIPLNYITHKIEDEKQLLDFLKQIQKIANNYSDISKSIVGDHFSEAELETLASQEVEEKISIKLLELLATKAYFIAYSKDVYSPGEIYDGKLKADEIKASEIDENIAKKSPLYPYVNYTSKYLDKYNAKFGSIEQEYLKNVALVHSALMEDLHNKITGGVGTPQNNTDAAIGIAVLHMIKTNIGFIKAPRASITKNRARNSRAIFNSFLRRSAGTPKSRLCESIKGAVLTDRDENLDKYKFNYNKTFTRPGSNKTAGGNDIIKGNIKALLSIK